LNDIDPENLKNQSISNDYETTPTKDSPIGSQINQLTDLNLNPLI
jgi:hypothetical protein